MTWNAIRSSGFALSASSRARVTNRCDGVPSGSEWNSSTRCFGFMLETEGRAGPHRHGRARRSRCAVPCPRQTDSETRATTQDLRKEPCLDRALSNSLTKGGLSMPEIMALGATRYRLGLNAFAISAVRAPRVQAGRACFATAPSIDPTRPRRPDRQRPARIGYHNLRQGGPPTPTISVSVARLTWA
jgi:hypothetical protein